MRVVVSVLSIFAAGVLVWAFSAREAPPPEDDLSDGGQRMVSDGGSPRDASRGREESSDGDVVASALASLDDLLARLPREDLTGAAGQRALRGLVDRAQQLGAHGVPSLVRALRSGRDGASGRPWRFDGNALEALPSLRAALLEALRHIPGEAASAALAEVLISTKRSEEGYLAALGQQERGAIDWEAPLLRLVANTDDASPDADFIRPAAVAMAARSNPPVAIQHMEREVPRDQARRKPALLRAGLLALPAEDALALSTRLLDDEAVTERARSTLLQALIDREDVGAWTFVREEIDRGSFSPALTKAAAEHAVSSRRFSKELRAYVRARRSGSGEAAPLRRQLQSRLDEARWLVEAAFGRQPSESDDKAAARARTQLAERVRQLEEE